MVILKSKVKIPSRIFCSNSSNVGSMSSQPSGGDLRLRRTFGIIIDSETTTINNNSELTTILDNKFMFDSWLAIAKFRVVALFDYSTRHHCYAVSILGLVDTFG